MTDEESLNRSSSYEVSMHVLGKFPLSLMLICVSVAIARDAPKTATTDMFNAMQQLMTGEPEYFDQAYLISLMQCWDQIHPDLRNTQDIAWQAMVDYSNSDGFEGDSWGGTVLVPHYFETNKTDQDFENILIYEPCNYVSNVAFYHVSTEFCQHTGKFAFPSEYEVALGQAFSFLGFGSSFWHGSHTLLGTVADNRFIANIAYAAHQASVAALGASSTVTDFASQPREETSVEMITGLSNMFLNQHPSQWKDDILETDVPGYFISFAGIVCTSFTLALNDSTVDTILPPLMDLFDFPEDQKDFILNVYLPEIRMLTSHFELGPLETLRLQGNIASAVIKLMYAFVWQEQRLNVPFITDPEANVRGAELIPIVNGFANSLNDYTYYEQRFQDGYDIYPGDYACNRGALTPHSKWHLESALGLMDLVYLADHVYGITAQTKKSA